VGYGSCKRLVRDLAKTLSKSKSHGPVLSKSYGPAFSGFSLWWET